jgi:hypothetical protein
MKKISPVIILIMLVLQACSSAPAPAVEQTDLPAAPQESAPASEEAAPATSEPIVHTVLPQAGERSRSNAHDHEESTTFENKNVIAGDEFIRNQFERPFTSDQMTYVPDVDIVDFGITSDDQFFYIRIDLAGLDTETQSMTGLYGVEIDRNADGRAEIMLAALPPYSAEFTAENVVVLVDRDGDIGGTSPTRPDEEFNGNGYDGVIFDLSQNIHPEDPDLAWVRAIEGDESAIEIAYRKWIFKDGNESFMWSVWASGGDLTPSSFNLHDTISESEAGSPNKGNANYPIKALAQFDNSCRVPLGFEAAGNEPLGCTVKGPEKEFDGEGVEFCGQFGSVCARDPNINEAGGQILLVRGQ